MPDPYAQITEADPEILEVIIDALELRASDPQQVAMRETYFSWIGIEPKARILEGGCGTGAVARHLAKIDGSYEVVGLDPSPRLIQKAKELSDGFSNLRFEEGDARSLPFDDASFDVVVFHTCLCHVPGAEKALEEAYRVLRPGGVGRPDLRRGDGGRNRGPEASQRTRDARHRCHLRGRERISRPLGRYGCAQVK